MAVGLRVRSNVWPVGSQDFLHAFYSTIAARLEPEGWGTRLPALQSELYGGRVEPERVPEALGELRMVRDGLRAFAPSEVVWDADDPARRPPWGDAISPEITDLSSYFVTQDGQDLFEILEEALSYAERAGAGIAIESGV